MFTDSFLKNWPNAMNCKRDLKAERNSFTHTHIHTHPLSESVFLERDPQSREKWGGLGLVQIIRMCCGSIEITRLCAFLSYGEGFISSCTPPKGAWISSSSYLVKRISIYQFFVIYNSSCLELIVIAAVYIFLMSDVFAPDHVTLHFLDFHRARSSNCSDSAYSSERG